MGNKMARKPVKVLQVTIGDGSYGGVASFMFSYYSHMNQENIHFDFLYCGENSMKSKMESPILNNSKITVLHVMKPKNNGSNEYRQLLRELRNFFDNNQYDIVHVNTSNVLVSACVIYAVNKSAICIAHSHNTKAVVKNQNRLKELLKDVVKAPGRHFILKNADYYFACSKAAGKNLYGEKALDTSKFRVIKNAIDLSKYCYNPSVRAKVRKTDRIVIGHVGRLTEQKNPFFLIDVFFEIHKVNPKTELWMIGEGELLDDIRKKVDKTGLHDNVVLWGRRSDVAELMQAMDMFMLPSLYEGLSIVAIEAQASGLPIYASDCISDEHKVTPLVQVLPLSLGAEKWAKKVTDDIKKLPVRRDMTEEMLESGYEISLASQQLERFYVSIAKNS